MEGMVRFQTKAGENPSLSEVSGRRRNSSTSTDKEGYGRKEGLPPDNFSFMGNGVG